VVVPSRENWLSSISTSAVLQSIALPLRADGDPQPETARRSTRDETTSAPYFT